MHIKHAYEHGSTRDVINLLGISLSTFYRWLKSGALVEVFRTAGGHRRFDLNQLKAMFMNSELEHNRVVIYSRVSSHDQKNDLIRQEEKLVAYCKSMQFENVTSISDLGSGLNYKKAGLTKLLKMILHNEIDILIINHKDRLLRSTVWRASNLLVSSGLNRFGKVRKNGNKDQGLNGISLNDVTCLWPNDRNV